LFEDSLPLPGFLSKHPHLHSTVLRATGKLVEGAFAAGLWHRDLHPDNILARAGAGAVELMLIDLDRAEMRASLSQADRDRMLVRMARYLLRHADDLPVKLHAPDFLRFLAGMGQDKALRRATMERVLPRYRSEVARHRLAWR
jgi:tRNA A-37 threonylcarbamoyl transferase component Bud32